MKKLIHIITIFSALFLTGSAFADVPDSLHGLKTVKIVVDLNQGSADILKLRLNLLSETMDNIAENGVKPIVIVAVRGQASRFMTISDSAVAPDERAAKADIQSIILTLKKRGVKFEQCAIALRLMNISPSDIISALKVVKNGYVSLVGYQNQGYAILPME